MKTCEDCGGEGGRMLRCGTCNGSGEGMYDGSTCRDCRGMGEIGKRCETCDGTGEVEEDEEEDEPQTERK